MLYFNIEVVTLNFENIKLIGEEKIDESFQNLNFWKFSYLTESIGYRY